MMCRTCGLEAEAVWCSPCLAVKKATSVHQVILVCGPPGAGKSTLVAMHKKPGDLVWDFDVIQAALTGLDPHARPEGIVGFLLAMRDGFYSKIRGTRFAARIWIIDSAPRAYEREWFQREFGAAVVLLDTPKAICRERLSVRGPQWTHLATEWWAAYNAD